MSVDYKKLLKTALKRWLDDEGQCWTGKYDKDLSDDEAVALKEILSDLGHEDY